MIKLYKDVKNVEHQLKEWKEGRVNILFITGLSGSGKTTLAKKLAKEHNAKLVSLDQYLKKLMRKNVLKEDLDYEEVGYLKGVQYLLEDNPEGRIIFEGGQLHWLNQCS